MSRLPPAFRARPFAHRGLHDRARPENSLAAIAAAIGAGYGVEFDVQLAADGAAVVFHDDTLDRMTGETGRVDSRGADALARVTLGGTGETIPPLDEVLGFIAGRAPVLLEIKDQSGCFGATDGRLEQAVCDAVEASGQVGTTAIMSFNPHAIAHVRERLPEACRGLVAYDFDHPHDAHVDAERRKSLARLDDVARLGCDFISYGATSLPTPETQELRAEGMPVFCWTIRSPQQAEKALRHSDQITFEDYLPS